MDERQKIVRDTCKGFLVLAIIGGICGGGMSDSSVFHWTVGIIAGLTALAVTLFLIWLVWRFTLHLLWMIIRTMSHAWHGGKMLP